jgi:hypothetical protein
MRFWLKTKLNYAKNLIIALFFEKNAVFLYKQESLLEEEVA